MKKQDIYNEINKVSSNDKDFILVNDEVIVQNSNLNDDWFCLSEYYDEEETDKEFSFEKVEYVDGEVFAREDGSLIDVDFKQPVGCVIRYEVK